MTETRVRQFLGTDMVRLPGALAVFGKPAGAEAEPFDLSLIHIFYLWFGYALAPQKSLELIRAAGFDSVSLWWGEYSGAPGPGVQARWAGENGLSLDSAHFPDKGADTLWQPGSAGDRLAQTVRQALFQCGEAGVPVLVMHLTEGFRQPPFTQWGMERLRRLADAAAEAKVRLALENLSLIHI